MLFIGAQETEIKNSLITKFTQVLICTPGMDHLFRTVRDHVTDQPWLQISLLQQCYEFSQKQAGEFSRTRAEFHNTQRILRRERRMSCVLLAHAVTEKS